ALSLAFSAPAQAITITASQTFNPVLQVDAGSSSTALPIPGLPTGPVTNVRTTVNLTKCDDPISSAGVCEGPGFSFNSEIVLRLISPSGTTVNLIDQGTFSGQTPGATATFTFDQSASNPIGGDSLVSGTFRPTGNLNDFIGQNGNGNWTLFFKDTAGSDPLSINSFEVQVTAVPLETDALPVVVGAAFMAGGLWWKKKRAKSKTNLDFLGVGSGKSA
ncbi:MAG: proprotein convertase P-domain-containing protein, partial [Microcystaceae cyanobacterium]